MLKFISYTNSLNEKIDFRKISIMQDQSSIFGHEWKEETLYGKIVSFKKELTNLPFVLCITGADAMGVADNILDIIEKDIVSEKQGVLKFGDWYIPGYFKGKNLNDYNRAGKYVKIALTFVTDSENWYKEQVYTYRTNDVAVQERGLGYDYGYPYDFLSSINAQNLYNTAFVESHFVLNIYGPVINPAIMISGHTYQVNTELYANEYLTIDSRNKTIIRTTSKGKKENEYANRSKESYIFQKIPTGISTVSCLPTCNFDITIIEERSEPKWT